MSKVDHTSPTLVIPPIPINYCDSSDISDEEIKVFGSSLYNYPKRIPKLPGHDSPKPYRGQGTPLHEAIREAWNHWRNQLIEDARAGSNESQLTYALALWRGDRQYGIQINRTEAFNWMQRAANEGKHDRFRRGDCGAEHCYRCHAQVLLKRMKDWFYEDQCKTPETTAMHVALFNPSLIFHILSYCDVSTLLALHQVNNFWQEVINDARAWAHIDMTIAFPLPKQFPRQFPAIPSTTCCSVCKKQLEPPNQQQQQQQQQDPVLVADVETHHDQSLSTTDMEQQLMLPPAHIQAATIPNPFRKNFRACTACFYQRAGDTMTPMTLQGAKLLLLQHELKREAIQQIEWEKYASRRMEMKQLHSDGYVDPSTGAHYPAWTLSTLRCPVKPAEYDRYRQEVLQFQEENHDLLPDLFPDYEYVDEDDSECSSDSSDSDYGYQPIDDDDAPFEPAMDSDADEDENDDEDDDDDCDYDALSAALLAGEDIDLFGPTSSQKAEEKRKRKEELERKREVQMYYHKVNVLRWYDQALADYLLASNLLMVRQGILWRSHPLEPTIDQLFPELTEITQDSGGIASKQDDHHAKIELAPDTNNHDATSSAEEAPQHSTHPRQRNGEVPLPYVASSNDKGIDGLPPSPCADNQSQIPTAQKLCFDEQLKEMTLSPYALPHYTTPVYPSSDFVVDTTHLWSLVTNLPYYRRKVANWQLSDRVLVQYPTPRQFIFTHGDALETPQPNSNIGASNPTSVNTADSADSLVYEIFNTLLTITKGFRYLVLRQQVINELFPRLHLRYDPKSNTTIHDKKVKVKVNPDLYASNPE